MYRRVPASVYYCFPSTRVNCSTLSVNTYPQCIAMPTTRSCIWLFDRVIVPLKIRLLLQWRLVYKINDDKLEFILIGTQAQLKKVDIDNLTVGDSCISPSTDVIRNLGAWFHVSFTMSTHITKTCKTGFFYLHNICRIRKLLTQEITENLIHAL